MSAFAKEFTVSGSFRSPSTIWGLPLRMYKSQACRTGSLRKRGTPSVANRRRAGVRDLPIGSLGHIVSWNAGAERLKGYRTSEVLGKHFSVFYEPKDVQSGGRINLGGAAQMGSARRGLANPQGRFPFLGKRRNRRAANPDRNLRGSSNSHGIWTERRGERWFLKQAKEELELRVEQPGRPFLRKVTRASRRNR